MKNLNQTSERWRKGAANVSRDNGNCLANNDEPADPSHSTNLSIMLMSRSTSRDNGFRYAKLPQVYRHVSGLARRIEIRSRVQFNRAGQRPVFH